MLSSQEPVPLCSVLSGGPPGEEGWAVLGHWRAAGSTPRAALSTLLCSIPAEAHPLERSAPWLWHRLGRCRQVRLSVSTCQIQGLEIAGGAPFRQLFIVGAFPGRPGVSEAAPGAVAVLWSPPVVVLRAAPRAWVPPGLPAPLPAAFPHCLHVAPACGSSALATHVFVLLIQADVSYVLFNLL